ncbi:hypothetical protein HOD75_00835 [archaeon]|jgi:processive 1,2-diacylglycerol beta-glucosyltransferase|nr:hypothetical protein [archaeon]MBT4241422.1 hypothetical protein [archaeon]MBT4417707.1 hypothetical protein [archaeon]
MIKKKKILILYEEIGLGHKNVAEIISKELKKNSNLIIKSTSIIEKEYFFIKNIVEKIYLILYNNFPFLWTYLHQGKSNSGLNKWVINIVRKLVKSKFEEVIDEFKPDLIISSYAFSAGIVSLIKKEGLKTKSFGVVTDFYMHDYWIYNNIDKYLVVSKDSVNERYRKKLGDKVIVTGIPVDDKFLKKSNKNKILKKLKLDKKKPIVLIVGGSGGLGNINKIVNSLESIDKDFQMIVVTGKNKKLHNQLSSQDFSKNVKIFGFVDNLDELMSISEILVGKPGGSVSAEAIAKRIPIIYWGILSGQEKANALFLNNNKIGYYTKSREKFEELISDIIDNPLKIKNYKKNIEKVSMDNALKKIIRVVENNLG